MYRNSTLTLVSLIVSVLFSSTVFSQTTYVNAGTATNYSLAAGDSLYISSGAYTGKINSFAIGAKITIAAGATFEPQAFSNPKGSLINYGIAKFNDQLQSNDNFKVSNYGTFWSVKSATLNGSDQSWTNNFGAIMKFDNSLTLNGNNAIINSGNISVTENVSLNGSSSIFNKHTISISGDFSMNSGTSLNNQALFQTGGSVTFNSNSTLTNICRLVAGKGISNNSNNITNYGLLWAKASANNNTNIITNNGTITNGVTGKVKSVNFVNNSTLAGSGYYYLTGTTTNYGTIGVTGTTTDSIRIYETTRTNPNKIFDTEYGNVRPNTVYAIFNAPDTANNFAGCASEIQSNIPLPVKWNYFYVNVIDNTPAINWAAEQDPGTVFEVERSYDGSSFSSIYSIADNNKTVFNYNDQQVNTNAAVVYYRIKATEPTGQVKLSETKVVKFRNNNSTSIQTVPNPFTSYFSINYQASAKEVLSISVYNMAGQLQKNKTVTVSNGYNSIAFTDASSLAKGMYMVHISNGNKTIASEKIMKQ